MDRIFEAVWAVLAVGGTAAALAYGLFVWLGRSWIEHKFSQQLQQFRHEQAAELERLRHEISRTYSRITKIHEREFAALPRAWELLVVAHGRAMHLAFPLKEIPDFRRLSPSQIEECVASAGLKPNAAARIRDAEDKSKAWLDAKFWADLDEALRAQRDLHNYVGLNWIFMTDELRDGFLSVDKTLKSALLDLEESWSTPPGTVRRSESFRTIKALESTVEGLGRLVQRRLRYEDA
jgi:hypothetical protein